MDENFWRFVGEERFSQSVRHPGIAASRRLPPGPWGIVHAQPLALRGSLRDLLDTEGALLARVAAGIGLELLEALASIHEAGVIHNDVKPDNILFDADGTLKLIDFGVASAIEFEPDGLRPGAPVGSPGYMAPELARGGWPSVRSDLYSAGVVLAQALTGVPPDPAAGPPSLAGVPAELAACLARLLAPEPARRFAAAREAGAALAAAARGLRPVRALTLDVEGTLVPSYHDARPRRGLRAFLEFCEASFDRVFIYTLLSAAECAEVFASLAGQGEIPPSFPERYEYVQWPRGADGSLKDLRRCRVPVSRNALVDDMAEWVPEDQDHRWVPVISCADVLGIDRGLELAERRIRDLFALE
jgi:serine/threonine protein kinase